MGRGITVEHSLERVKYDMAMFTGRAISLKENGEGRQDLCAVRVEVTVKRFCERAD